MVPAVELDVEVCRSDHITVCAAMARCDVKLAGCANNIHPVDSQPDPARVNLVVRVGKLDAELVVVNGGVVDLDPVRSRIGTVVQKVVGIQRDQRCCVGREGLVGCASACCIREIQVHTARVVGSFELGGAQQPTKSRVDAVEVQAQDVAVLLEKLWAVLIRCRRQARRNRRNDAGDVLVGGHKGFYLRPSGRVSSRGEPNCHCTPKVLELI